MNRPFFSAVFVLDGVALAQASAGAQPNVPGNAKTQVLTLSVSELEQFLGGRTLISLDLKDATLEEVAAALSQASGQKIGTLPPFVSPMPRGEGAPPMPPPPRFSLSTTATPFWPALRKWQLDAWRADKEKEAATLASSPTIVRRSKANVLNSFGLLKLSQGLLLQADNTMAAGRAVEAWPFLLVATDLKRTQEAQLSEEGLREIVSPRLPLRNLEIPVPGAPKELILKDSTPEEKRWLDHLVLSTQAYIDPKLNPVELRCEIEEAIDEKGNDLRLRDDDVPSRSNALMIGMRSTGTSASLPISLRTRPDMGKRLVKLRGILRFRVVTRSQHWETTQLQTPVEDTIQQLGGEFKVQFAGLEKQGDSWGVKFAAQSRGLHLARFWTERVSSRAPGAIEFPSVLNFDGVPQMSLVDDKGNIFRGASGGGSGRLTDSNAVPGAPMPNIALLDTSPVPPDAAQNLIFEEERHFRFDEGATSASGTRLSLRGVGTYRNEIRTSTSGSFASFGRSQAPAMGRPIKLIVDFPLEYRQVSVPFEFTNLPLPPK